MNDAIHIIEEKTAEVREKLYLITSPKCALFILYEYYQFLLNTNNRQLTEAYISEFIQTYLDSLQRFDPFCLNPSFSQSVIEQAEIIAGYFPNTEIEASILEEKKILNEELSKLNNLLNVGRLHDTLINKLCFPLLEENEGIQTQITTGILETVTIKVSKAKDENKFLLIPSEVKIESRLQEQIETSWQQAVEVVKRYAKKIALHHEVIIRFDKRVGFYRGNSLGAALTLAFIEELLNYYNSPVVIKTGNGIALTGGLNEDGSLIATSKEVIEKKVENVFFSPIQTFVVPEKDFPFGEEKLKTLKQEFPKRKLNLIGIETFDDLLDSRKLVNIRKQKIVVRSAKFAKKNWAALTLIFLLAVVVFISGLWDFDTNPAFLENRGKILFVKNRNGKILWTKKMGFDLSIKKESGYNKVSQKICDVDLDGSNEVILCNELFEEPERSFYYGRIACFEHNGDIKWYYTFKDSISSGGNQHTRNYRIFIIDILDTDQGKVIYAFAQSHGSFPSSLFKLNAENGMRIGGVFWHPGSIVDGKIGDFDENGKKEIVLLGINNGYERSVIFSINLDEVKDRAPSTSDYLFHGYDIAKFNSYVLLPKTDYAKYLGLRYNLLIPGELNFSKRNKDFTFITYENNTSMDEYYVYNFTSDLKFNNLNSSDGMQVRRDSLVSSGLLPPPFTNTIEYRKYLVDQFEVWDGKKLLKRVSIK